MIVFRPLCLGYADSWSVPTQGARETKMEGKEDEGRVESGCLARECSFRQTSTRNSDLPFHKTGSLLCREERATSRQDGSWKLLRLPESRRHRRLYLFASRLSFGPIDRTDALERTDQRIIRYFILRSVSTTYKHIVIRVSQYFQVARDNSSDEIPTWESWIEIE